MRLAGRANEREREGVVGAAPLSCPLLLRRRKASSSNMMLARDGGAPPEDVTELDDESDVQVNRDVLSRHTCTASFKGLEPGRNSYGAHAPSLSAATRQDLGNL